MRKNLDTAMRLRTSQFFVIILIVTGFVHPGLAKTKTPQTVSISRDQAEDECAAYPNVPINVNPVFDEPRYNYTVDIGGLQKLAQDPQHTVHGGHNGLTLGLTRYEPILEFRIPIRTVKFPDGVSCVHVDHVDVNIGYRKVVVYIPKEVPNGSCGFDQVMAHEQKHVAVNRDILNEYAPTIAQKLQDYLRVNGVFKEANADYASQLLNEKLKAILFDMSNQIFTENQKRQQLVDSPEEYRRVSAACNGQLTQAAQQYYRTGK